MHVNSCPNPLSASSVRDPPPLTPSPVFMPSGGAATTSFTNPSPIPAPSMAASSSLPMPIPGGVSSAARHQAESSSSSKGVSASKGECTVAITHARDAEALYSERGHTSAREKGPTGFPFGPIQVNLLEETVKLWCRDATKGGGGFAVVRPRSMVSATSRSGTRCAYQCRYYHDGANHKCSWFVEYEYTSCGWCVHHANFEHDEKQHLSQSSSELMTDPASRVIPDCLISIGRVMARTNLSIGTIKRVIDGEAHSMNMEITWEYSDIRRLFAPSAADKEHDAAGIIEELEKRRSTGLEFMSAVDSDSRLKGLFVECEFGMAEWARGGTCNTVLFDPTASTNRYRLKLCPFTTVSPSGQTVVIAYALIDSESEAMFEWVFRCFITVFKVPPLAFFTDGDPNIARALGTIRELWPNFHHFLCIFHLSKNLYTHIHPLYNGNVAGWREVHNEWWRLAKDTDCASKNKFDAEFDDFIALVGRTARGETKSHQLDWLKTMKASKHKWAARYTWSVCTWGIHSTQRAEAMQSALKGVLVASMMLTEVLKEIEKYNVLSRNKRDISDIRRVSHVHHLSEFLPPWIRTALTQLTPYAQSLLIEQYKQSMNYESTDESDGKWLVSRLRIAATSSATPLVYDEAGFVKSYACNEDFGFAESDKVRTVTRSACSCQYAEAFGGLPCRHELCVLAKRGATALPIGNVKYKWLALTDAQKATNLCTLRRHVAPSGATNAPRVPTLTRNERKLMILDLARDVATLGSASDNDLWTVRQEFQKLCRILTDKDASTETTEAGGTAAGRDEATAVRRKAELNKELGQVRRIANFPSNQHLFVGRSASLVGRSVAVLWNGVGWCFGLIHAPLRDNEKEVHDLASVPGEREVQCNFSVKYNDGPTPVKHILVKELYYDASASTFPKFTWALIEECNLDSGVSSANVRAPGVRQTAGRPPSARLKPASGPTSGGKKSAAKKRGR